MLVLGAGPDLLQVLRIRPVHRDRVLEIAGVGASNGHGSPDKLRVVSQLEVELGGGAHSREEHILQVDEWCARTQELIW